MVFNPEVRDKIEMNKVASMIIVFLLGILSQKKSFTTFMDSPVLKRLEMIQKISRQFRITKYLPILNSFLNLIKTKYSTQTNYKIYENQSNQKFIREKLSTMIDIFKLSRSLIKDEFSSYKNNDKKSLNLTVSEISIENQETSNLQTSEKNIQK